MAVSVCVACGGSFTIPGPDRAPYCFACQEGAETAARAVRSSSGALVWAMVALGVVVLGAALSYGVAAEGPRLSRAATSVPVPSPVVPTGR